MKKLILTFTVLMLAVAGISQSKTTFITIQNEKGVYTTTKTGSITRFVLTANEAELKAFKDKIAELPYAKLEVKKDGKNTYNCKLSLDNSTDIVFLRRTLGHAGYETFYFNGQEKKSEDLQGILQQLQ